MTEDELTRAIAEHPEDPAPIAVYGDWLAERGDPLGEYIGVCCKLADLEVRPARMALLARQYELRDAHQTTWLARWNQPLALFDDIRAGFMGLPSSTELTLPIDVDALERQTARFPIQYLRISAGSRAELDPLSPLPLLRRIPELTIWPEYPKELEASVVDWLADARLANLTSLTFSDLEGRPRDVAAMLDTLSALERLHIYGARASHGLVDAITTGAPRLSRLTLYSVPLGAAMVGALARLPALRELDVTNGGLDDSIAELPPIELPITSLGVDGNAQLGARGLAWLVRASPQLAEVELPRELADHQALDPIAHQLESIMLGWDSRRAALESVVALLPRTPRLRRLGLGGPCAGLVGTLLASTELHQLQVRGIADPDVVAIARSPRVATLELLDIDGDISDAAIAELARSPHLATLRHLSVTGARLTEAALAALLAAPWPWLETIFFADATLRSADGIVARPALSVTLFKCTLDEALEANLQALWGVRLRCR